MLVSPPMARAAEDELEVEKGADTASVHPPKPTRTALRRTCNCCTREDGAFSDRVQREWHCCVARAVRRGAEALEECSAGTMRKSRYVIVPFSSTVPMNSHNQGHSRQIKTPSFLIQVSMPAMSPNFTSKSLSTMRRWMC